MYLILVQILFFPRSIFLCAQMKILKIKLHKYISLIGIGVKNTSGVSNSEEKEKPIKKNKICGSERLEICRLLFIMTGDSV